MVVFEAVVRDVDAESDDKASDDKPHHLLSLSLSLCIFVSREVSVEMVKNKKKKREVDTI